jgi:hypothetical protein
MRPNLVGFSRHIPHVVSMPFEASIEVAGESAVEGDETVSDMSVDGLEDVSLEEISCINQQSFPLLHLINISRPF